MTLMKKWTQFPIPEPQPQQEMIQSENSNQICARSDGTEFEEMSQEMDAWTTGMWVLFPSLTEHCTSMEMDTICASEMNINSETLAAFTCSAVYDMATSTTLPLLLHRHRSTGESLRL